MDDEHFDAVNLVSGAPSPDQPAEAPANQNGAVCVVEFTPGKIVVRCPTPHGVELAKNALLESLARVEVILAATEDGSGEDTSAGEAGENG